MPQHIFYSWQADTPSATGKNLIGRALKDAISMLNADAAIEDADRDDEDAVVLDHDTKNVSGSPPIVQIIFEKIDGAAAFVSDLTYVAERKDGRKSPNPNVLFEHGWAWKSLTWRAVISVMNTAHGDPREHALPFDLQHNKGPIFFDCPDDADVPRRQAERARLAKALAPRLKAILNDKVLAAARVPQAPAAPHPHDVELIARWRTLLGEPLRRFLREQNFGDAYLRSQVVPLHEIHETWHGAQFEFDDPELRRPFIAFLDANGAFCDLLVERTHVMDTNLKFAWPETNRDRELGLQPSTLEAIDELNARSTALADAVDAFERAVRSRIRVPVTPQAAPVDGRRERAMEALASLAADRNMGGVPRIVSRPCLTVRIAPFAAQERKRLDPGAVTKAQYSLKPDTTASYELSSDARQWWICAVPEPVEGKNPESCWLVRLVRPGVIEAEVTIGSRPYDVAPIIVEGQQLERELVSWSERLAGALDLLGLGGAGLLELSLDGVEDVVLQRAPGSGKRIPYPHLQFATIDVDDLSAQLAPRMHDAFDILWQSAGWRDGSPSFVDGNWTGYDKR